MGIFVNFIAGASTDIMPVLAPKALLVNVAYDASSPAAIRATQEMFEYCQPEYKIQDCGGFQLLKKAIDGAIVTHDQSKPVYYNKDSGNIGPIHVIEAALVLRLDIIMSLDLPINKTGDPCLQYEEFIKNLGCNLVWMRETSLLRKKYCPEIELFIPIQCYTLEQFEAHI